MRSHLHWAGHLWKAEPIIYEKTDKKKYFSRLLKYSVQDISLFNSPFLCSFISRSFFPIIFSILQSPLFIFHPPFLEEENTFSIFKYQKQNQRNLSFLYTAVSSPEKQSQYLRTRVNKIFLHWLDIGAFFLYYILKIYWEVSSSIIKLSP